MSHKKESTARMVTFNLLRNRPASLTLRDVAIGAKLTETWVRSFHLRGDSCSSSVDKVETLYTYLTGKTFV